MTTQTTSPIEGLVHRSWQVMLVLSILEALLGIAVLAWPGATLKIVGILFGVFLVVSGVSEIVVGLSSPVMSGGFRFLNILTGVLSFILGIVCFREQLASLELLGVWIGIGWLMVGFSRLFIFISLKDLPGRVWAIAGSVIMILAGVLAIVYPITSVVSLTIFGGVWLVILGVIGVVNAFQWRRAFASAN